MQDVLNSLLQAYEQHKNLIAQLLQGDVSQLQAAHIDSLKGLYALIQAIKQAHGL